ncbi:MAG: ABC transporter permease subunit [Acidobacteriota bacterium]
MLLRIARFELAYQLRQPLFWLVTGFLAVMTFVATSTDGLTIGGAIGNTHRNAPFIVIRLLTLMSLIGTFITTVFVAGAILRDFQRNTHELFFARPVRKLDYLLGRFLGGYAISCLVFLGAAFGMFMASLMPWLDAEQLGPITLVPYLFGLLVMAFPNLLFCGAVFFALASLTRKVFTTYLGLVGFFVCYFLSRLLLGDIDDRWTAALLDPFGMSAFEQITQYWTLVERNSLLPELPGLLLTNRLLWLAIAVAFLGAAIRAFQPTAVLSSQRKRAWRRSSQLETQDSKATEPTAIEPTVGLQAMPRVTQTFTFSTALRQFLHQARLEIGGVFRSVPFLVVLGLGLLNLIGGASSIGQIVGTPVLPVTHLMVQAIQGAYVFLLVFIITFYSGELIWKERSVKLSEIYDAMPTPNWVYLGAKIVAQMFVVLTFLTVGVLATIGVQANRGYFNFELPVYAQGFIVTVIPFLATCCLASFLQVVAGRKLLGFLLMIVYLISKGLMPPLGFEHNLYRFSNAPRAIYSDMNGYGHYVQPLFWFYLYWAVAAAILVVLGSLLWVRGTETSRKARLSIAAQRFRGPVRGVLAALMLAFLAIGGWIFYNTNVLNEYTNSDQRQARRASYEQELRQYKDADLPRITGVNVSVDIFPEERRVEARGQYRFVNRNDAPLEEIHLSIPRRVRVNALELPAHSDTTVIEEHGYTIYRLTQPLAPGEEAELSFDLTVEHRGFVNAGSNTSIVRNGTFFNNTQMLPSFGYNERVQLVDRKTRRKHGLPVVHRMAQLDDASARGTNYISHDADWIDFETTVSTRQDQIAIAPGYLQKEWKDGERRYFHYKMDAPILNFYAFLSAEYEVARDQLGDVAIEIYHHPGHTANLDRMIDSVKQSITYFEAAFGPYPHRQMRIIEFPRYASFAQAFPNTVPFSESIGFIADFDPTDEEAIDYPFYVTSHEVAHQWWAHQAIGANVQGATLLSETLAQYSALMVMEQEYGTEKMRRFLKYELDRYLRNRGGSVIEELPLVRVENPQAYIAYNKGSLAAYALRDAIGEEAVNRALSRFLEAVKFQQPPYTISLELMDFLRQELPGASVAVDADGLEPAVAEGVAPEGTVEGDVLETAVDDDAPDADPFDAEALLADLFEHITLFDNRVEEASASERPDGTTTVSLVASAKKLRADGEGRETEVPIDDWIDIGVFGADDEVLHLEKHRITDSDVRLELVVEGEPVRVGIDPYNKLIDRNSDDNLARVSAAEG